jgi:hypothetical protein
MLKKSRMPLDFSKEQIKNLQQRNALTQQLLVSTLYINSPIVLLYCLGDVIDGMI